MSDLVERTGQFLAGLLTEAEAPQPAEDEDRWGIRDKLALAKTITDFLAFKTKFGDDQPSQSQFGVLKDALGSRSPRN